MSATTAGDEEFLSPGRRFLIALAIMPAGAMQATEVVKELLGIGDSLSGHLIVVDALGATQRRIRVAADPGCPLCGDEPTITSLVDHADGQTALT